MHRACCDKRTSLSETALRATLPNSVAETIFSVAAQQPRARKDARHVTNVFILSYDRPAIYNYIISPRARVRTERSE